MSKYSKISLILYLSAVLFMVAIGVLTELIKAIYPTIKGAVISFRQKVHGLYSTQFRNSGRELTTS